MNPLSMELVQFTQPLRSQDTNKEHKMVEFDGRLYAVEIRIKGSFLHLEADIKVYKVNEESGELEVVKNLGDVVFVLGKHSNFSLSAQDYHGIEGNSIYFDSNLCNIFKLFRFSLKDSKLTTVEPFCPCPDLFKKI
jgi:hypothetical protein